MNRRHILSAAAALPLAACGTATVQQIVSDADVIANDVTALLPDIKSIVGMTDSTFATISTAVASVKSGLGVVETAVGAGLTTVQSQVQTGMAAVSAALSGFKVPAWVNTILGAAEAALPFVLKIAGVSPGAAKPGGLTYPQAMKILRGAAS